MATNGRDPQPRWYARAWHALTAAVAVAALTLQLVLVCAGSSTLVEQAAPPVWTGVLRYFLYFTIQSNLLVLVTTAMLARDPRHDGRLWRIARVDAVVGIAVTGFIHWFFLRPLLDLQGWAFVADKMLHVVVPLLAVVGWIAFGPRDRITRHNYLPALAWLGAYVLVTVVHGAWTGFYPYPFTDVTTLGYARVIFNGVVIALFFLLLVIGARHLDRVLSRRRAE